MIKKLEYTATNTGRPILIKEMILAAKLKSQGYTTSQIKDMSKKDNIFQGRSEHNKVKIASTVSMRLDTLDEFLTNKLFTEDLTTAKQIIIYSIMKSDKFFFEFMNEVYRDKIILREFKIYDNDIKIFIQRKQEQIPQVSKWTELTIRKLKTQYLTMLKEADFIKRNKEYIEIIQPVLDSNLYEHIIKIGDEAYIKAMIGEI